MKLRDLAEQAVRATSSDPDGGLELDEIYQLLDVSGGTNPHLSNPLNHSAPRPGFHPRPVQLSGDEDVEGRILTLDFCGHDPSLLLREHESIESMEGFLVSGGGILNPFTTFLLAFVDEIHQPYIITYEDSGGNRAPFDKLEQLDDPDAFDMKHPNPVVEWDNGPQGH